MTIKDMSLEEYNSMIRESHRLREEAYKKIFIHGEKALIKAILDDLKTFTNMDKSIFNENSLSMARLAGRQEVYLHIMKFLQDDN